MKNLLEIIDKLFQNGALIVDNQELTALSAPLPAMANGKLTERFFLYPNLANAVKRRPCSWISVDSESGKLLQYNDCAVEDFAAALNIPLNCEIDYSAPEGISIRELVKLNQRFIEIYQELRTFAFVASLGDGQKDILEEYHALSLKLWRPELRSFYEALSPEFFDWLIKAK